MKSIQEYIQQQRHLGYSDEQIRSSLSQSGYSSKTISQLLSHSKGMSLAFVSQLQSYVDHLQQQGYSQEQIRSYLRVQGYEDSAISRVLKQPKLRKKIPKKIMFTVFVASLVLFLTIVVFSLVFHSEVKPSSVQEPVVLPTIDDQYQTTQNDFVTDVAELDSSNEVLVLVNQPTIFNESSLSWALQAQTSQEAQLRCEQLDSSQRLFCITQLAAQLQDDSLCQTLDSLEDVENCLMNAFVLQGDASVCQAITLDSNKQLCLV